MAELLVNTAQSAMDLYYGEYKSNGQFFEIEDFVTFCGMTVSDLLLQEYRTLRAENRSEKLDEVIPFSADWLAEEVLDVKEVDGEPVAVLSKSVMTFPYDSMVTGFQDVVALAPRKCFLERGTVEEEWSYRYLPATDRIFWLPMAGKAGKSRVKFFNKGLGAVSKVRVRYVPSPHEDMVIPDSILNYVVSTTVANIKNIQNGVVVDKTNDGNPNKVLESEINKKSLR